MSAPALAAARLAPFERWVAYAVAFGVAARFRLPFDIPLGFLVAVAILPVAIPALTRFRGGITIALLTAAAALSGVLLTAASAPTADVDGRMLAVNTVQVLSIGVVTAALLWARSVVGTRGTVLAFGLGMLVALTSRGIDLDNPWKFSFAVPVILIVLSLPGVFDRRWRQSLCLAVLCVVSLLNDSRSLTGMLLVALVLTLTQGAPRERTKSRRVALVLTRVALVGLAGFFLLQAAILEGLLGQQAQERTQAQIAGSGSSLAGGRPEMGAAFALLAERPWGYGAGTFPSPTDITLAKTGMDALGYDPHNGYVSNYMFGYGFEVHSVIGDLWIGFGIAGVALAAGIGITVVVALGRSLADASAQAVVVFLALRLLWDLPFSPLDSTLLTLPIALATLLTARHSLPTPGMPQLWPATPQRGDAPSRFHRSVAGAGARATP